MNQNITDEPILLIDDEIHTLNGIKLMLELEGFRNIHTIVDSREVMPFLQNNRVSAVLLDLVMPYISGEELLSKITREFKTLPIIINTSSMDVHTAIKCLTNGAFDYVIKPVEKQRLISAINKALAFNELHKKNQVLKEALKKSEELNNIKGQLLEVISHEFRTPLNAIIGFSSIALERQDISDDMVKCLTPVLRGGKQILRMIDNVIYLSMITGNMLTLKQEPVAWKDLFKKALEDTFNRYPEKADAIEITDNTEQNIPEIITTDHKCLQTIINEIMDNAVKFTQEGTITYTAELSDDNQYIQWKIEDTGCGVTKQTEDEIFNIFHQADMSTTRVYEGIGVGLSLTKSLLRTMNGSISITNRKDTLRGLSVCFKLPHKSI